MTFDMLCGLRVHEMRAGLGKRRVPVRPHEKRRTQRESYHKRIAKKWLKRYGTREEEVAYLFSSSALGLLGGGDTPNLDSIMASAVMLRNIGARA